MEPCKSANSSLSLLHLGNDYVLNNIDTVYPVLIQHFSESNEDSVIFPALRIALGPCLDLFSLEELDEKLLKHACPCAVKVFIRNLRELESCRDDNNIDISECFCRCEEITSLLAKAMEFVATKDSTVEIMKISSLLLGSSELLYESYSQCAKSKQSSCSYLDYMSRNLTSFFRKTQELQQSVMGLVSKIEISSDGCAIDVINEILTFLYKSGMVLLNLDVKTMADLWKGYICTLDKYSEFLRNYHEISVPVECLSSNLTNKIDKFITEDIVDMQNSDKTVKILCFVLKVIIKITEKFTGCLKNCQKSLINLLVNLNKFSHSNLSADSMQQTKMEHLKQLVTGVDPLLSCLINDIDFIQEFSLTLESTDINTRYPYLLLSCLIVKKLTYASDDIRNLWFSSDDNILRWIFQILAKCNFELCLDLKFPSTLIPGKAKRLTDCYGYLLMNVSAFLLMSTSREFTLMEKVLMKYVVHTNPWCSILAADIWCILARFADSELCYDQLNVLIKMLNNFGLCSEFPQKFLLESLIKRLFPLLSEKHKEFIIQNHPRERHPSLWSILSIKPSENIKSASSLQYISSFLSNRNFNERDVEEMECLFLGLDMNLDKEVEGKIVKLWKFDSGKMMSNAFCKRYLNVLCSATRCVIPIMSSSSIYQVLREIKSSLPNLTPVFRLHCLDIIYSLAKAEDSLNGDAICKLISSLFYELLTNKNIFVRIRSMDLFSNFAYSTCQTQIITQSINNDGALQIRLKNYLQRKNPSIADGFKVENYLEKLDGTKYEHSCKNDRKMDTSYECVEPPYKKISLDKKIGENLEVEQMIFTLKKDVVRLQQLGTCLSAAQRKEISLISDMLREVFE